MKYRESTTEFLIILKNYYALDCTYLRILPSTIFEYLRISFWDKIEEIGVWKWHKKYPYKRGRYEQLTDGYNWKLKLRDRNGRAKYCSGYESFPRNFKDLIKELNNLFGSKIEF